MLANDNKSLKTMLLKAIIKAIQILSIASLLNHTTNTKFPSPGINKSIQVGRLQPWKITSRRIPNADNVPNLRYIIWPKTSWIPIEVDAVERKI